MDYCKGKVKFFVQGDENNYGFVIVVGQNKDIFFHKEYGGRFENNIFVQDSVEIPKKDDIIILQIEETDKGKRAKWWCHGKDFKYNRVEYCYCERTGYEEQHPKFHREGAFKFKILVKTNDLDLLRKEWPRKEFPVFERFNLRRFFTRKAENEKEWVESYDPR